MKPVIMFITSWCPYCKQAYSFMEAVKKEKPEYAEVDVRIVDEEKEPKFAKQYDYYYVPTYYVDGIKVHEGVPSLDIVREVFEKACK